MTIQSKRKLECNCGQKFNYYMTLIHHTRKFGHDTK